MDIFSDWVDYITFDLPPGKPLIPQYYYVNAHKGSLLTALFIMMIYFNNFSLGAWVYFSLHGSYGVFWILKDITFPDQSFRRKCTLLSFLFPFPVALLPLAFSGYYVMSG